MRWTKGVTLGAVFFVGLMLWHPLRDRELTLMRAALGFAMVTVAAAAVVALETRSLSDWSWERAFLTFCVFFIGVPLLVILLLEVSAHGWLFWRGGFG